MLAPETGSLKGAADLASRLTPATLDSEMEVEDKPFHFAAARGVIRRRRLRGDAYLRRTRPGYRYKTAEVDLVFNRGGIVGAADRARYLAQLLGHNFSCLVRISAKSAKGAHHICMQRVKCEIIQSTQFRRLFHCRVSTASVCRRISQ
jgi:hypothetical protein